jgi:hypothetical protein
MKEVENNIHGVTTMTQIMIDAQVRSKLMNLSSTLELVDETGRVLGVFTPRTSKEPQISEEELDRREQEEESFSTAEVLAHLEKL